MGAQYEWCGDLANDEYVERQTGLRVSRYELKQIHRGDTTHGTLNVLADIYLRGRLAQKMKDETPRPVNRNVLLLLEE